MNKSDETYQLQEIREITNDNEHFINSTYPNIKKLRRPQYEVLKEELQVELLKMQKWVKDTGQKLVIIFEGRDAAGKGGTIKRFMEHMNPRSARVVALQKPTEKESGEWYFQRYVQHLPTKGEIVLFDRSWYNRAGVERVMGFCSDEEYTEFMLTVPKFEQMLTRSGIILVKYWFSVTREEQQHRFESRRTDFLKQWKLSPIDQASIDKWDLYTKAKETMFAKTDTSKSPWIVIKSNDKKRARIECMRDLLNRLDYSNKNEKVSIAPNPLIVGNAAEIWPRTPENS
ncbi:MAG: polyphosphate kinase 2 [bacterium]